MTWLISLITRSAVFRYALLGTLTILALTVLIGGFYLKSLQRDLKDEKAAHTMTAANLSQCQAEQQIAKEVSSENQAKLTDLSKRLAAERLRRSQAKCIPIKRTTGSNGSVS